VLIDLATGMGYSIGSSASRRMRGGAPVDRKCHSSILRNTSSTAAVMPAVEL
jgi:hypothetical protein